MVKKFISEFVGTMLLVIFGCGTAVAIYKILASGSSSTEFLGQLRIIYSGLFVALAFGLILMALVYTIGKVSGCHVNPAISLACLIDGRMKVLEFVYYVIAQLLGGICGALALSWFFGGSTNLGANGFEAASALGKTITTPIAFVVEIVLTFVFALVVLSVTKKDSKANGIIIGLTLAVVHIFGLPFTGTSVNPARSLAPAVIEAIAGNTTSLTQIWIWILAPLAGGALAAVLYSLLFKKNDDTDLEKTKEVEE